MGTTKTLNKSKKILDDEYYTLYDDIASELPYYKEQFKDKRILCPCDWDESYNEEIIFKRQEKVDSRNMFSEGSIGEIDIKASKERIEKDIKLIKCNFAKFLVAHADDYNIKSISVSGYNPYTGQGVKFQDIDYSKYDLVITNPPFSKFDEFIKTLINANIKFLVIGPLSALTKVGLFPYFHENKMWLGYAKQMIGFRRPDGSVLLSKNPEGSVPRSCKWYTNLDVKYRHDQMILTESYYENPEKYPHYLNYDAIDVPTVKDIPYDYEGEMGVTTNFMTKYNPDQFEIVGISGKNAHKPDFELPKNKRGGLAFYLRNPDGSYKRCFAKFIIKNKHPYKD